MTYCTQLEGLVLPPEHILKARMDVVTQNFVPDSQDPGLLFTVYVPLKNSIDLTQNQLREILATAFSPYQILKAKFDVLPITYRWQHDDANNVWDAVVATGPAEYIARAQPAASITATPSPAYLDPAPKFVAVYQVILRPFTTTVSISTIDELLNLARLTLRDLGFANSMFSVNVQGVEPEPKNDLGRTLAMLVTTTAVATVGFMVVRATFMRTRL